MAKQNRDDFSSSTRVLIAKRAGWLCSFPTCRTPTVGATSDGEKGVIDIGTAAHICAAAPGGPRYDPNMSAQERSSAANGIWMCRDHGTAIDSADPEFTIEKLREWKNQAQVDSWRRVLRNEIAGGHVVSADTELTARIRAAAEADLDVFRRSEKWPSTSVGLILEVAGLQEHVTTRALAHAAKHLDDLILVAAPGMGKTTALFQIAEGVLDSSEGIPLVVPLGDWATAGATILESILGRPAFRHVSEDDFRKAATRPGVVLLLDGWNELDAQGRGRARVQLAAIKSELPEIGFVVSTRRQALDVPFGGTRVHLLPLSEAQQVEIAVAMRGDRGAKIVDEARRTSGVRELVTVPLYLTALLSLPENVSFPTTKEEVLLRFVVAHEGEASHAEALRAVTQGFHSAYLDGLAVCATQTAKTTIAAATARRSIFRTQDLLIKDQQITTRPEPGAVLDVLVSNHVLMHTGDAPGYSFQHQQFQEWFASHDVERRITLEVTTARGREALKEEVFNLPTWEEAILFATERLARGDEFQQSACAEAIVAAFETDPLLAGEMIFRSTDAVWLRVSATIQRSVRRWHAPGAVDRALRFMLTTGRHEFLDVVWPIITNENDQVSLNALRNCRRFRPSILGQEPEEKIKALPKNARMVLLFEMAMHSDMKGLDLASTIARDDSDPEVQAFVVDALAFRRAYRHLEDVLENASDETFDIVVGKGFLDDIDSSRINDRVKSAREREAAAPGSTAARLGAFVVKRGTENVDEELTTIIGTMDIDTQGGGDLQYIYQAHKRYPKAVEDGLLQRVRGGLPLFYGADDILASAGLALEDEELLQLALADPVNANERAEAAASVLGPNAVGQMVEALLSVEPNVYAEGKFDPAASDLYHGLQARIAHAPGASLIAAVVARSPQAGNHEIGRLADLISRHPDGESDRGRPFDGKSLESLQKLVADWGDRILASEDSKRWQTASVARLASRAPSVDLLPILRRLLDDNLSRYRAFREQAEATNWQPSEAVDEARHSMAHEFQRAFMAIAGPQTAALMQDYLSDEWFGQAAAQVIADQWHSAHASTTRNRASSAEDFAGVSEMRLARRADPGATSVEADLIFAAIEPLIAPGSSVAQKNLAVSLGIVASRLPHGQRDEIVRALIALAPRRARSSLLRNLILSGETISTSDVENGIAETLHAAQSQTWILTQSDGYELKVWLRLLPFASHPISALPILRGLPPAQREPHFLREVLEALADAPSEEAEQLLFELAEGDQRFYSDYHWKASVFRLGSKMSARRIVDLVAAGVLDGNANDEWNLARDLGGLIGAHQELRAHVYNLLKDSPVTKGLAVLARAVAENPDADGLLMLVGIENRLKRSFLGWRTIEAVVTEHVPSEDWRGAYDVVPVAAPELRKQLLAMTTDGGSADSAARCLTAIDKIRDQHGIPLAEPRHPDLTSGRSWPILVPDPDPDR